LIKCDESEIFNLCLFRLIHM